MKHTTSYYFSLLLSFIVVVVIYYLYGYYYEDTQKLAATIIYGSTTSPPYEGWFMENFLFQIPIITFLSDYFKTLPIFGYWELALLILRLSLWFYLTIKALSRFLEGNPVLASFISIVFVYAINCNSLVHIYYLRDAIHLSAISLLIFLYYYFEEKRKLYVYLLVFLLACLVRVSAAVLVLFSVSFLLLLITRSIWQVLNLLKFHWIFSIICLLVIEGYKIYENNPAMKIEQRYEYALTDVGAIVPISQMKSKEDSMRYDAIRKFFFVSDSAQINIEFINRVVDKRKYLNFGIKHEELSQFLKKNLAMMKNNNVKNIMFYLLLIVLCWKIPRRLIFIILMFNVLCWAVIVLLGIKLSMAEYFFQPWISMTMGFSYLVCVLNVKKIENPQMIVALILMVSIILAEDETMKDISHNEIEFNKNAAAYLERIKTASKNDKLIFWDFEQSYIPTDIFSRSEYDVLKKCSFQNLYFLLYYKFAQERFIQNFGASPVDWKNVGISLTKNSDQIVFVMDPNMAEFLGDYFKAMYDIDFILTKDSTIKEIIPDNAVFRLENNSI